MTFNMLKHCGSNINIKTIISRILLNNLVSKIKSKAILVLDHHKKWAYEILEFIRSDLIKDFTSNLQLEVTKDVKLEHAKNQIAAGRYNDAALLISKERFQDHFDIKDIMYNLVAENKLETIQLLIAEDEDLKKELIRALCNETYCKKAAQYIKTYHFDPDDFPEVKEMLMKKRMHQFLGDLYKQQYKQDFLTLDRIEDLLSSHKQMLAYLVEDLFYRNKMMEAKGIFLRHRL